MEAFLAEYTGYAIGAFGIGWALGTLLTYSKKFFEKI